MQLDNKSTHHVKTLVLFLMALSMLANYRLAWSRCLIDSYNVSVYTLTGEFETERVCDASYNCVDQPDPTNPVIKNEVGILSVKEGFIQTGSYRMNAHALGIDVATAQAINGKPFDALATWTIQIPISGCFARSNETYSFKGVPHVTISVKGSDGGTGGGTGGVIIKGKPTVSISAAQANAAEGGFLPGRFLIEFDAPRAKKINVSYAISGTARNGKDYTKIKGKVSIPAGESSVAVDISPIDDLNKEPTEKVTLKLKSGGSYKVNKSQKTATVEITDND